MHGPVSGISDMETISEIHASKRKREEKETVTSEHQRSMVDNDLMECQELTLDTTQLLDKKKKIKLNKEKTIVKLLPLPVE
jgi:uncharacterized protein YutE (UPF0331/DUF86 family)